jgi:hypothetical protein
MYPSVGQIIGFLALVIIMSSIAIVLNKRIEKRRMAAQQARNRAWVKLDVQRDAASKLPPEPEGEAGEQDDEGGDEGEDRGLQTRARQNGHYSESKKPG